MQVRSELGCCQHGPYQERHGAQGGCQNVTFTLVSADQRLEKVQRHCAGEHRVTETVSCSMQRTCDSSLSVPHRSWPASSPQCANAQGLLIADRRHNIRLSFGSRKHARYAGSQGLCVCDACSKREAAG